MRIEKDERAILIALYDATDGANWNNNTNWKTDKPLSEWHGVQTNDAGRVTGLRLDWNRLSGSLPSELGQLTNLKKLGLSDNELSGAIPSSLRQLKNLRIPSLDGNTNLDVSA